MWTLMLMVRGQVERVMLHYTGLERTTASMDALTAEDAPNIVTVKDDFGRVFRVEPRCLDGVLMQDVDRANEGNRMGQLRQARSEAKLQEMVTEDPTIAGMHRKNQIRAGGMQTGLVRN